MLRPRIERDFGGTLSFAEEMPDRGLEPETRLVAARPESAGEHVAAALGIEPGSPTLYLERLRLAGGEPLLLEQVHLSAERFPGLLASDLEHGSLYDLLGDRYDTRIVRAREALEPVLLHTREARLLGQPSRAPALLIEGTAFTAAGEPVEFARTFVRGDRTRYYIERIVVRSRWQTDETGPGEQPAAATGATAPQRPRTHHPTAAPADGRRDIRLTEPRTEEEELHGTATVPFRHRSWRSSRSLVSACGGSSTGTARPVHERGGRRERRSPRPRASRRRAPHPARRSSSAGTAASVAARRPSRRRSRTRSSPTSTPPIPTSTSRSRS